MIKNSLIKLIEIMPVAVQDKVRAYRSRLFRKTIVKKWEKTGRPIPPPNQLKHLVIEIYQKKYGSDILIETGTFLGDMVEAQRKNFRKIVSIEVAEELWKKAAIRFKRYKHISIIKGDSGIILPSIVKDLNEPAIFWLDGHYDFGITSKGEKDCPILEEIDAIFKYNNGLNHILLVDDARSFDGQGDYPTIDELTSYIKKYNDRYNVMVKDDIIRYTINQAV
jgi:hypothetical protein